MALTTCQGDCMCHDLDVYSDEKLMEAMLQCGMRVAPGNSDSVDLVLLHARGGRRALFELIWRQKDEDAGELFHMAQMESRKIMSKCASGKAKISKISIDADYPFSFASASTSASSSLVPRKTKSVETKTTANPLGKRSACQKKKSAAQKKKAEERRLARCKE